MRFMVIVKANKDSEAGVLPDRKILAAMGKFNEELVKAGVMLAGEGLQASSKGARVRFEGPSKRTVIDGPGDLDPGLAGLHPERRHEVRGRPPDRRGLRASRARGPGPRDPARDPRVVVHGGLPDPANRGPGRDPPDGLHRGRNAHVLAG